MTDKFVVPNAMNGVVAEVDVKRIVREEVERALEECGAPERLADPYLAARFGEGEPTEGPRGGNWPLFDGLVGSCSACRCAECFKDRARLDKLERFVTALAGIYEISNPGDGRVAKVKDAAREYLR